MFVAPDFVEAAASDLAGLGLTISEARTAAASSTTAITPAAADEVSAAIAALFSAQSREFHTLSARAQEFHDKFVRALTRAVGAYGATEATNAAALTPAARSDPFGAAGRFLTSLVKETLARPKLLNPVQNLDGKAKGLLDLIPKIPVPKDLGRAGNLAQARLAAEERQVEKVLTNGVKLLGKGGTAFYTDGQMMVSRVQNVTSIFNGDIARYARSVGLDEQMLRSLAGSQLHVFGRGEGLAQSYFQKIGNDIYQVDTDVQGRIIRRFQSTAAIFNRWVSMTSGATSGARGPFTVIR